MAAVGIPPLRERQLAARRLSVLIHNVYRGERQKSLLALLDLYQQAGLPILDCSSRQTEKSPHVRDSILDALLIFYWCCLTPPLPRIDSPLGCEHDGRGPHCLNQKAGDNPRIISSSSTPMQFRSIRSDYELCFDCQPHKRCE